MQGLGIEARLFHPFGVICGVPVRDHRKIIAIDRRISFTAHECGQRIRLLAPQQERFGRDTHVRIEGPTAWEMALSSVQVGRSGGPSMRT